MFHIATNYFPHFWQMHENEIGTQRVNTSFSLRRTKHLYFLKSYIIGQKLFSFNYDKYHIENVKDQIIKAIFKLIFCIKFPVTVKLSNDV